LTGPTAAAGAASARGVAATGLAFSFRGRWAAPDAACFSVRDATSVPPATFPRVDLTTATVAMAWAVFVPRIDVFPATGSAVTGAVAAARRDVFPATGAVAAARRDVFPATGSGASGAVFVPRIGVFPAPGSGASGAIAAARRGVFLAAGSAAAGAVAPPRRGVFVRIGSAATGADSLSACAVTSTPPRCFLGSPRLAELASRGDVLRGPAAVAVAAARGGLFRSGSIAAALATLPAADSIARSGLTRTVTITGGTAAAA
jgi:hypothetical protein